MTKQRMVAVVFAAALVGGPVLAGAGGALAAQDQAAEPAAPVSYDEQIEAFFARLAAGENVEAIDHLYAENPFAPDLQDQLEQLKSQLAEIAGVMGAYLGQERIAVQPIGGRFVYAWHVAYFEKRPFQLHFSFYKPRDRWVIYQLAYDQGLPSVAQDLAKRRLSEAEPE